MCHRACRFAWMGLLWMMVALGCSKATDRPPTDEDGAVREQFAELQSALKNRDTVPCLCHSNCFPH
jgi:hypothetical protein